MPMANACGIHIGELLRRSLTIRVMQTIRPPCQHEMGTTGTHAIGASLFRFEGVANDAGLGRRRTRAPRPSCPPMPLDGVGPAVAVKRFPFQSTFENCIASTSINVNRRVFSTNNCYPKLQRANGGCLGARCR